MVYIIVGIMGFVSLLVFDLMSMKNLAFSKYLFAFLGLGLIGFSTIMIAKMERDVLINDIFQIVCLLLAIVFLALLIYSVFIEVGGNTYQKIAKPELVTDGTYSLVRHPGVIWLFLTYLFAAIFFENSVLIITAFTWTIVNAIYIVIQEKLIFTRLFSNYDEYIKATPMLIPNITSMKKFVTTKNWRKE